MLDYRPALRARTGLGEYVHELARALAATAPAGPHVTVFTSSWKDRPDAGAQAELRGVRLVDHRWPVRVLDTLWQRLSWPPIERLVGDCDIVHSPTPLRIPARRAAQVVTLFDLYFLDEPQAAAGVAPSAFARLAPQHLREADHVIAGSAYAAALARDRLGVPMARVTVAPPGVPPWTASVRKARADGDGDCVLFLGTLEPRKNVEGLFESYARLVRRRPDAPPLVLAGRVSPSLAPLVDGLTRGPLASRVTVRGYVSQSDREALLQRAQLLVLPSWDEGFGLPALEAMACGVPVVVSTRGALPEVVASAGACVPPEDHDALARAMEVLLDRDAAREAAARGTARAAQFTWQATAEATRVAYAAAMRARAARG